MRFQTKIANLMNRFNCSDDKTVEFFNFLNDTTECLFKIKSVPNGLDIKYQYGIFAGTYMIRFPVNTTFESRPSVWKRVPGMGRIYIGKSTSPFRVLMLIVKDLDLEV